MEYVLPVVLGKRDRQSGAVYYGAKFADGNSAGHGHWWAGSHCVARRCDHRAGIIAFSRPVCGEQPYTIAGCFLPGDDGPVWHGYDERIILSAAQPGGLAYSQPPLQNPHNPPARR